MNIPEKTFLDYLQIALRRKWFIILPLAISIIGSYALYKNLPKVYRASTLILVQPQRVPESYVRPTLTASVAERLSTISEEILNRTRLERVVQEFNLYADLRRKSPMEEIIEAMRKAIVVSVQSRSEGSRAQNTFTISFEGGPPRTVMEVTNRLASLFMEENLRVRELQAEGTSEFMGKELLKMESQLKQKEEDIRRNKEKYMGQLPQQLEANLRISERLQQQLQTTSENIKMAENRALLIQNQIERAMKEEPSRILAEAKKDQPSILDEMRVEELPEDPLVAQWNLLQRELNVARSKYTENHPDVIQLRRKIANLGTRAREILKNQEALKEARLRELKGRSGKGVSEDPPLSTSNAPIGKVQAQLRDQLYVTQLEAKRLRAEAENLKEQMRFYQRRVEDTPRREQELTLLTRDYDLLRTNYQTLLEKKIQAQMAENLERKQQREQFQVLDPARIPEKPIRPDRNKILLIGAFFGLMAGLGLTWFKESLDQSFHSEADLEADLRLPILAIIPNLKEEKSISKF